MDENKNIPNTCEDISTFALVLNYVNHRKFFLHLQKFENKYLSPNFKLEDIYQHYHNTKVPSFKPRTSVGELNKLISKDNIVDNNNFKNNSNVLLRNKSYNSVSRIQEGYIDLIKSLCLENTNCPLGKVVKHIIDLNISVLHINIVYSSMVSVKNFRTNVAVKNGPEFTRGHFTKTDSEIIKKNFKELCDMCHIQNTVEFLKLIEKTISSNSLNEKRQRNVIGCFLSRKLEKPVRHCSDVVDWATKILSGFNRGKFSKKEKEIIIEMVDRCGDNTGTWKSLAEKLNRDPRDYFKIRRRYEMNLIPKKNGKWNIKEDEVLLAHLFKDKDLGIDSINSVVANNFKNIIELKRDFQQIVKHYEAIVKPILLAYHLGMLYTSYKYEYLSYVVKNGIISEKEVQWNQVLKDFPSETKTSLNKLLSSFRSEGPLDQVPLYEKIRKNLSKYKNHQFSKKEKEYRDAIVHIYTNLNSK